MSSKRGEDRRVPLRAASPSRNARGERGASTPARIAAVAAVLVAFVVVVVLLFGGGDGYKYTLMFQTGGQLVPGNEVLVAGQPVGTVDSIDLTDDNQAAIAVTMQRAAARGHDGADPHDLALGRRQPLHLAHAGPEQRPRDRADGSTISGEDTTSPVDIDQLFNIFRAKRARGAAEVHPGQRHRLRRQGRARQPRLQVPQPGPQHLDPAVHRALAATRRRSPASSSRARRRSARSPTAARTSPR